MKAAAEFIELINDMTIEELEEVRQHVKENLNEKQYKFMGMIVGTIRNGSEEEKKEVKKTLEDILSSRELKSA